MVFLLQVNVEWRYKNRFAIFELEKMTNNIDNKFIEFEYEIPFTKIQDRVLLKKGMKNAELVTETGKDIRTHWERFSTIKYREDKSEIIQQTYSGYIHRGEIVGIKREDIQKHSLDSDMGRYFSKMLNNAGIQNDTGK